MKQNSVKQYKLIILGLILFLLNLGVYLCYTKTIGLTGGSYIYPLDDIYIHLAMAKNLVFHGNWGIVAGEFCSTSSSPVFTFLISICIWIFGDSPIYPLALNIIFANLLIILLFFFLRKYIISFLFLSFFLFCPVLLFTQVMNGMEHTLHILLISAIFICFYNLIKVEFNSTAYKCIFIGITCFSCLTRYESMFFIAPIILFLIIYKQYRLAIYMFLAAFVPIVLLGLYSICNGGFFFPNSLLMKGYINVSPEISEVISEYSLRVFNGFKSRLICVPGGIIVVLMLFDFYKSRQYNIKGIVSFVKKYSLPIIVLITLLEHAMFADFGWLFRYEAYLFMLLYLVFVMVMTQAILSFKFYFKWSNVKIAAFVTVMAIIFLFLIGPNIRDRVRESKRLIGYANKNIYDQQMQMALFLKEYYNLSKVMANDIGAITYFTDAKVLDIVGLGSNSILRERMNLNDSSKYSNQKNYKYLTKYPYNQYKIIIINDAWFNITSKQDYERMGWIKTGQLIISDNIVCASDDVTFYTSDIDEAKKMREHLRTFRNRLPSGAKIDVYEE